MAMISNYNKTKRQYVTPKIILEEILEDCTLLAGSPTTVSSETPETDTDSDDDMQSKAGASRFEYLIEDTDF